MAEQLAELNKGDLEVYSTDEKQIGVWIDGKPIYQKAIPISNIVTGSNQRSHNISNLGTLIDAKGTIKRSDNLQLSLPFVYTSITSQIGIVDIGATTFSLKVGSDFGNLFNYSNCGYVILTYTKS